MSQEDVAKQLGISQRAYAFYEDGNRNPKPQRLKEIAKILEIPSSQLISLYSSELEQNVPRITLDEALPDGGVKRTLRDYVEIIEKHNALLYKFADETIIKALASIAGTINSHGPSEKFAGGLSSEELRNKYPEDRLEQSPEKKKGIGNKNSVSGKGS